GHRCPRLLDVGGGTVGTEPPSSALDRVMMQTRSLQRPRSATGPRAGWSSTRPPRTAKRAPVGAAGYGSSTATGEGTREEGRTMDVLRRDIGDVLRGYRQGQGRPLCEVYTGASGYLGY